MNVSCETPKVNSSTDTERLAVENILNAGRSIARMNGIANPKRVDIIWELIREAAATEQALPDRERRWLSPNLRGQWIGETIIPVGEWQALWNERMLSGMEPYDAPDIRHRAVSNAAIDRMGPVLSWLRFIKGRNVARDRSIILAMALDAPLTTLRHIMRRKCHQNAIYDVKYRGLRHIELGLSRTYGLP